MSYFLFRSNWNLLWQELWIPLSENESAPPGLFIELIRYAYRKLGLEPKEEALKSPHASEEEREAVGAAIDKTLQVLNNAERAREEFMRLPIPSNEKLCVTLLEGFYEVLSDLNADIALIYYQKL